ncbi:hypothetical protein PG988_008316 [Apiospora saccharicola]
MAASASSREDRFDFFPALISSSGWLECMVCRRRGSGRSSGRGSAFADDLSPPKRLENPFLAFEMLRFIGGGSSSRGGDPRPPDISNECRRELDFPPRRLSRVDIERDNGGVLLNMLARDLEGFFSSFEPHMPHDEAPSRLILTRSFLGELLSAGGAKGTSGTAGGAIGTSGGGGTYSSSLARLLFLLDLDFFGAMSTISTISSSNSSIGKPPGGSLSFLLFLGGAASSSTIAFSLLDDLDFFRSSLVGAGGGGGGGGGASASSKSSSSSSSSSSGSGSGAGSNALSMLAIADVLFGCDAGLLAASSAILDVSGSGDAGNGLFSFDPLEFSLLLSFNAFAFGFFLGLSSSLHFSFNAFALGFFLGLLVGLLSGAAIRIFGQEIELLLILPHKLASRLLGCNFGFSFGSLFCFASSLLFCLAGGFLFGLSSSLFFSFPSLLGGALFSLQGFLSCTLFGFPSFLLCALLLRFPLLLLKLFELLFAELGLLLFGLLILLVLGLGGFLRVWSFLLSPDISLELVCWLIHV